MLAELAQGARRGDDDQRVELVSKSALLEQLGGLGGELLLLELVIIGLLIAGAMGAGAGEGASRRVAFQLPILAVGMAVLALHDQVGKIAVALVPEEEALLAVGDDDEAVVRNPHFRLLAVSKVNAEPLGLLRLAWERGGSHSRTLDAHPSDQ